MGSVIIHKIYLALVWLITTPQAQAVTGNFGLDEAATSAGYKTGVKIPAVVGAVLTALFGLIAILFFGMMLFAGYNWMTAMGDSEKVTKAKDTLITASIGLVIVLAAYAITTFVFSSLTSTTMT